MNAHVSLLYECLHASLIKYAIRFVGWVSVESQKKF